jgi:hypothetical protein
VAQKHVSQESRPHATHTVNNRFSENAASKSRFVTFQIQIVDKGRGLQIRAPCAFSEDHASKLYAYVTGLVEASTNTLDGHDLIRLAAHLGAPMLTHPERWHQRKPNDV